MFDALVWMLQAGAPWRLLPSSFPSKSTCHARFQMWEQAGVFERVLAELAAQLGCGRVAYMDGCFVRARCGGDEIGLTRHGKGSKIGLLVDEDSRPLSVVVVAAGPADQKLTGPLLDAILTPLPDVVVADRAWAYRSVAEQLAERDIDLATRQRRDHKHDPSTAEQPIEHYRERWRVERSFAWIAWFRRLATRWEKKAANYIALLQLACALILTKDLSDRF